MDKKTGDLIVRVKNEINVKTTEIVKELIAHAETIVSMCKDLDNMDEVDKKYITTLSTMSRFTLDATLKMMDAATTGSKLVAMGLKEIDDEIDEIQNIQNDIKHCADNIYKDDRVERL